MPLSFTVESGKNGFVSNRHIRLSIPASMGLDDSSGACHQPRQATHLPCWCCFGSPALDSRSQDLQHRSNQMSQKTPRFSRSCSFQTWTFLEHQLCTRGHCLAVTKEPKIHSWNFRQRMHPFLDLGKATGVTGPCTKEPEARPDL